jgi:hypothetical protein
VVDLLGGGVCAGNSRVTMFATKMALRTWLKLNPGRTSFKTTPCPALSFRCHLRTFLSLIPLRVFLFRKRPLLTFALTFLLHLVLSTCTTHTYPSAFSPATVYTLSRYVFTRSLSFINTLLFVPDVSRLGSSCALYIGSLARPGQKCQSHIDPSSVYTSKQAIHTDARHRS